MIGAYVVAVGVTMLGIGPALLWVGKHVHPARQDVAGLACCAPFVTLLLAGVAVGGGR